MRHVRALPGCLDWPEAMRKIPRDAAVVVNFFHGAAQGLDRRRNLGDRADDGDTRRDASTMPLAPRLATSAASAAPIPIDAPVMTMTLSFTREPYMMRP